MRGIYYDGSRAVYREDLPMPVPEEDESLIRILLAAVCNTDKEILRGYRPNFRGVMGHEFVGIVEQSPDASLVGKLVVGELNRGCGRCIYCRTGREKHCPDRKVIGMEGKDGCFAEYMTLATHLIHVVPEGLEPEQAIFTEPLAAALEVPSRVHIDPAKNLAMIGDGRLALMTAQVLSLSGIEMTVIGKHPEKLELFRPYARVMTLEEAQNSDETYEYVAECSGHPSGLLLAKDLVRRQGTILLKSTYAGEMSFDMSYLAVQEITIAGTRCGPFPPALNLLQRGMVKLPPIELHDLSEMEQAFHSSAFKAGFRIGTK